MDKYRQDKYWLDNCHSDRWDLVKKVLGTYLKSLVKIGSVTAEILLTLSFRWWVVVVVVEGGVQSHFHVKPKLG